MERAPVEARPVGWVFQLLRRRARRQEAGGGSGQKNDEKGSEKARGGRGYCAGLPGSLVTIPAVTPAAPAAPSSHQAAGTLLQSITTPAFI